VENIQNGDRTLIKDASELCENYGFPKKTLDNAIEQAELKLLNNAITEIASGITAIYNDMNLLDIADKFGYRNKLDDAFKQGEFSIYQMCISDMAKGNFINEQTARNMAETYNFDTTEFNSALIMGRKIRYSQLVNNLKDPKRNIDNLLKEVEKIEYSPISFLAEIQKRSIFDYLSPERIDSYILSKLYSGRNVTLINLAHSKICKQ